MDSRNKPAEALNRYISILLENYKKLLDILRLEADDIVAADTERLSLHVDLEIETVKTIVSVTNTIYLYLEKIPADEEGVGILKEVEHLRQSASEAGEANIRALKSGMSELKIKIQSIKLPKSARRVYYSGNNPTLMDIEI